MSEDRFTKKERAQLDDAMSKLRAVKPAGFKSQPVYVSNAKEIAPMLCVLQVSQWRFAVAAVNPKAIGADYCAQSQMMLTKPLTRAECKNVVELIGNMAAIVYAMEGREQAQLTLHQEAASGT